MSKGEYRKDGVSIEALYHILVRKKVFLGTLKFLKKHARNTIGARLKDLRTRRLIDAAISRALTGGSMPLFSFIEIETINRCNGSCSFCPVNKYIDPRSPAQMSSDMFFSILKQLREIDYKGTLSFHSNNEPLLDSRIIDFVGTARETLPNGHLVLFTNGILLSVEKFRSLMQHLDFLVIDNYSDIFAMHPNIREIYDYWKSDQLPDKEVVFSMRMEDEELNSRGGYAPNRKYVAKIKSSCLLPFSQMTVRPDGKLSLCCNDALGKATLGNLQKQSVVEAWNSEEYRHFREAVRKGRQNFEPCSKCDTFLAPGKDRSRRKLVKLTHKLLSDGNYRL